MSLLKIAGLPITKVSQSTPRVNMLVYGESGIGKTRLAGSADAVPDMRRTLFIDVEGGTLTLRDLYPDVETVRVRSWTDLQNVYDALFDGKHDFTTVIIDSLTEVQKMCFSADTELLTPTGWKFISEFSKELDLVAQYEMGTELISFVVPSAVMSYHHHGDMVSVPTASSALLVTDNHRMLTRTQAGTLEVRQAKDLRKGLSLPTAGTLLSLGGPTPEQARLLVAWAADGHRNVSGMKFHLKEQDKIDRLQKLITECGLTYEIPNWNDEGTYILVKDAAEVTKFMPDRMWQPGHMFWSLQTRDAMMSEMPYWDSTPQPSGSGSFCYRTKYQSNADAIAAIAALTGWSVSTSIDHPGGRDIYRVNLVRRSWRTLTKLETIDYNDSAWCVTVPSGFLITRRDGKVTVAGNSMDGIMLKLVEEYEDRSAEVPGLREWNINLEQTRKFVRAFRDLPMNTIFTALVKSDKNPRTGAMKRKPSLSGKLADEVSGFLDIVVYLYAKEIDGENKRILLCGQTEDTVAKDRSNKLPMTMEEPTMSDIWQILNKANEEHNGSQG